MGVGGGVLDGERNPRWNPFRRPLQTRNRKGPMPKPGKQTPYSGIPQHRPTQTIRPLGVETDGSRSRPPFKRIRSTVKCRIGRGLGMDARGSDRRQMRGRGVGRGWWDVTPATPHPSRVMVQVQTRVDPCSEPNRETQSIWGPRPETPKSKVYSHDAL